jgi:hypothetical protein
MCDLLQIFGNCLRQEEDEEIISYANGVSRSCMQQLLSQKAYRQFQKLIHF